MDKLSHLLQNLEINAEVFLVAIYAEFNALTIIKNRAFYI